MWPKPTFPSSQLLSLTFEFSLYFRINYPARKKTFSWRQKKVLMKIFYLKLFSLNIYVQSFLSKHFVCLMWQSKSVILIKMSHYREIFNRESCKKFSQLMFKVFKSNFCILNTFPHPFYAVYSAWRLKRASVSLYEEIN